MKIIKNEKIKRALIAIIITLTLSNFIMPNYVCAADLGGVLFKPITELLLGIADRVMAAMEGVFVGDLDYTDALVSEEITSYADSSVLAWVHPYTNWEGRVCTYHIRYSPAVIFSGLVATFDINYINPKGTITYTYPLYDYKIVNGGAVISWRDVKENYGASGELQIQEGSTALWFLPSGSSNKYYSVWSYNGKEYYFIYNEATSSVFEPLSIKADKFLTKKFQEWFGQEDLVYGTLYEYVKTGDKVITKKTITSDLQSTVAKWYAALRMFALVGLMAVLVYIGIRIILSSGSAQNQAKYKHMLVDWLVAVCILFTLHYIMAFTMEMTGKLTEVFSGNSILVGDEDVFFTNIRNKIAGDETLWLYFGYIVMYLALVILTVTYTIEYLKRTFFIAFLTMIAPLIALTYPLDKVKDGQAQAFSMWIKEFVYNCLVQPVHLLLYVIFIGSAQNVVEVNPIYAIIALACFKPAEKFFRKMFGLDKASSINTLGAAAGGALVMNAINKMKSLTSKKKSSEAADKGQNSGVRTASRNVNAESEAGAFGNNGVQMNYGAGNALSGNTSASSNSSTGNSRSTGAGSASTGRGSTSSSSSGSYSSSFAGSNGGTGSAYRPAYSAKNGFKAVGKKIFGFDAWKTRGKKFTRSLGGAALGFGSGLVAVAANVADGDLAANPSKAIGEIAATAGVGYAVGTTQIDNAAKDISDVSETFEEGALGTEEYNNRKFDKKFFASDVYKRIAQDSTISNVFGGNSDAIKLATQQFLDNGISDANTIRASLQNSISGDTYRQYSDSGITDVGKIHDALQNGISAKRYKEYSGIGINSTAKMRRLQSNSRIRSLTGEQIKQRQSIAKAAAKRGLDEDHMYDLCRRVGLDHQESRDFITDFNEYFNL